MEKGQRRELVGSEGKVILDMIRRLNRRGAIGNLKKLVLKTHPADLAMVFRHLNDHEKKAVFDIVLRAEDVGEFLSELDDTLTTELVTSLEEQNVADIISDMAADDAVDLLELLPEELASSIREHMEKTDREEVEELLQYHPESAGGLMSTDYMSLYEELTVGEAIKSIQKRSEEKEMVFYLYITYGEGQLAGVVSLRELLMHSSEKLLKNIMNPNVISVNTDTDQEEVAHVVSQYNILAVPVVDSSYNMMGIVTVDDIIDVIREEATEDFLQMAGAGKDREILLKSTKDSAIIRAPWLLASWLGGVIVSLIINNFEQELSQVIALAAFIPVIIGMGGNIATQSSTIVVRGIATGRVNMAEAYKLVFKELRVGLILGLLYGVCLGFVSFLGHQDIAMLGVVVGLAVFLTMAMSSAVGTMIPLILKRFDVDAAVATGPFVTTSIDLLGVLMYFAIAKYFLGL